MDDLLKLAERCEQATGELSERALLLEAFNLIVEPGDGALWSLAISRFHQLLLMGAFLDAATNLFPGQEGGALAFWRSGNDGEGGNPDSFKAELLICGSFASKLHTAVAATEPLARCAAALRARSSVTVRGE